MLSSDKYFKVQMPLDIKLGPTFLLVRWLHETRSCVDHNLVEY